MSKLIFADIFRDDVSKLIIVVSYGLSEGPIPTIQSDADRLNDILREIRRYSTSGILAFLQTFANSEGNSINVHFLTRGLGGDIGKTIAYRLTQSSDVNVFIRVFIGNYCLYHIDR